MFPRNVLDLDEAVRRDDESILRPRAAEDAAGVVCCGNGSDEEEEEQGKERPAEVGEGSKEQGLGFVLDRAESAVQGPADRRLLEVVELVLAVCRGGGLEAFED